MNTKRLLIYGIGGIAIIVLAVYGVQYLGKNSESTMTETPSLSPSVSVMITPAKTPTVTKVPGDVKLPPGALTADYYKQFTKPATCEVKGSVKFNNPTTAADTATIVYTGIDSPARQISWNINPTEPDMRVGPNIDAGLPLPNGSWQVIVILPKNPTSKTYSLTAKMTYGRLVGSGIVVSEVACTGAINVERNY